MWIGGWGTTGATQQTRTNSTRTASLKSEDVRGRSDQEKETQVQHWQKQWLWIEGYSQPGSRYPLFLPSLLLLGFYVENQRLRDSYWGNPSDKALWAGGQGIEGWRMDLKNDWELLNIFPLPHTFFFSWSIEINVILSMNIPVDIFTR